MTNDRRLKLWYPLNNIEQHIEQPQKLWFLLLFFFFFYFDKWHRYTVHLYFRLINYHNQW